MLCHNYLVESRQIIWDGDGGARQNYWWGEGTLNHTIKNPRTKSAPTHTTKTPSPNLFNQNHHQNSHNQETLTKLTQPNSYNQAAIPPPKYRNQKSATKLVQPKPHTKLTQSKLSKKKDVTKSPPKTSSQTRVKKSRNQTHEIKNSHQNCVVKLV